jgi:hypothetical protein
MMGGHSNGLQPLIRLNALLTSNRNLSTRCRPEYFGSGFGRHELCTTIKPSVPCYFYSFGIAHDFSFDVDVANKMGCFGFAADPTVQHPSLLHPKVTFHHIAAKSLTHSDNQQFMFVTSVTGLRVWLKHDQIAVLKMDCEGCEYSIARDVAAEDPDFFSHVQQFGIEIHYSKKWLKGAAELSALANLLHLLRSAGLELVSYDITTCAPEDQATGLVAALQDIGLRLGEGHCHNYLFARV